MFLASIPVTKLNVTMKTGIYFSQFAICLHRVCLAFMIKLCLSGDLFTCREKNRAIHLCGSCWFQHKVHFLDCPAHISDELGICLRTTWSMSTFNVKYNPFLIKMVFLHLKQPHISKGIGINFVLLFSLFKYTKTDLSYSLEHRNVSWVQSIVTPYIKAPKWQRSKAQ